MGCILWSYLENVFNLRPLCSFRSKNHNVISPQRTGKWELSGIGTSQNLRHSRCCLASETKGFCLDFSKVLAPPEFGRSWCVWLVRMKTSRVIEEPSWI